MASIHVGDVGTVLTLNITDENGQPMSLAGIAPILSLQRPDRTVVTIPAEIVGDGSAGQVSYTTDGETIFDQAGKWTLQVLLDFSGAQQWYSTYAYVDVSKNIPIP